MPPARRWLERASPARLFADHQKEWRRW